MIMTNNMSAAHYESKEILLIFSARASKEKVIEKQLKNTSITQHLKEGMTFTRTFKKNRTAPFFPYKTWFFNKTKR